MGSGQLERWRLTQHFDYCGSGFSLRLSLVWMDTKRPIIVATYMIPTTDSIKLNERATGDAGVTSPYSTVPRVTKL